MRRLSLSIHPSQEGKDINTLLRKELGLSGSGVRRAKQMPDGILLDGCPVFTNARVRAGQTLSVAVGDLMGSGQIAPVPGPLDILYEDEDLLVLNKPAGLAMHPMSTDLAAPNLAEVIMMGIGGFPPPMLPHHPPICRCFS